MKNNTRVTRRFSALLAIVLALCTTTVTPAWACPPPERPTMIATPSNIGTASPDEERVTTLPAPPIPKPSSVVSNTAISAEIGLSGSKIGAGIQPLEGNELKAGYVYAVDAYIQTSRPVKNLRFKLQGVPRYLERGEEAVVTLEVSYEKKGLHYALKTQRTFVATSDIALDNQSTIFNSSASKGVSTWAETGENNTLDFTFESRGVTPKDAFVSTTVWLTANTSTTAP